MTGLSDKLNKVRAPEESTLKHQIISTIIILLSGAVLGVIQKRLDATYFNELPYIFQKIDIINFFGRLSIWILLAVIISIYSKNPRRASVNVFAFFTGMLAGYYIYCNFVLGFLSVDYMLKWVVIAVISMPVAYLCWYAKGEGKFAVVLSAGILGVLLAQAISLTQGIYVYHFTEICVWLIGVILLRRKPKELIIELILCIIIAALYQLVIPFYG